MSTPESAAEFLQHRPRLFAIAYRMLGSRADADDVLQDTWLRWDRCERSSVANVGAFLTRIVTNASIDALRRAQASRVDYPGPWLPEPILDDPETLSDGEAMTDLAQTLSIALLALLEQLPPHERATFVLREALGMSFAEIAECLDANAATCRQWSKRARDHLAGIDWRTPSSGVERKLLEQFAAAMAGNDINALVQLLDPDVVLMSDGGGKVAAASRPLHGVRAVSRFFGGLAERMRGRFSGRLARMNGQWGGVVYRDGVLDSVYCLRSHEERITAIYIVRNPDKLGRLDPPDFAAGLD